MQYLDFELLIESAETGYRARVVHSPVGQASAEFSNPLSEQELENFLLKIGRPRTAARRGFEAQESDTIRSFGGRLFEAVFSPDILNSYVRSLDAARASGSGLRIRLRVEASELWDVPWEYLYQKDTGRFLCLTEDTPLVRYLDLPEPVHALSVRLPIRVLVMVSSPTDFPPLEVEAESAKLDAALADLERSGSLEIDYLDPPTLDQLSQRLQDGRYHILHFIGHGGFEQKTKDGVLHFEDETRRGRPVSGRDLGILLHDNKTLRLVVLNACEGARSSRADPFAGTAQSLVRQGIPAVLAMQFEISDPAAITLAEKFYRAVAEGDPIDQAVTKARKGIFAKPNQVEWATPVLFMRSPNGRLFNLSARERRAPPARAPEGPIPAPAPLGVEPVTAAAPDAGIGARPPSEHRRAKAVTRHFRSSPAQLATVTSAVRVFLAAQQFDVQVVQDPQRAGILIQARKSTKAWQKILGMSQTLNVALSLSDDDLSVQIGTGEWVDTAARTAAGAFAMLAAWPVIIPAGIAWWQESHMPDRVFQLIENKHFERPLDPGMAGVSARQSATVAAHAPPPHAMPVSPGRFCSACGSALIAESRYCGSCGTRAK